MTELFSEPFDYADGVLAGQGGWSGSNDFVVMDGQLVNGTTGYDKVYKSLSGVETPTIIDFYAHVVLCEAHGDMTLFFDTSDRYKCGIGITVNGYPNQALVVKNAWNSIHVANLGALACGVFYSIGYTFNTVSKVYSDITFAGVNYGSKTASSSNTGALTRFGILNNETYGAAYSGWDNINYTLGNNYTKFPRWQKTKNGLRPTY